MKPLVRNLLATPSLFKDAATQAVVRHDCLRSSASLSYYALFSIFPLLLICVFLAGHLLGGGADVRDAVVRTFADATSNASTQLLDDTLRTMQSSGSRTSAGAVLGVATLLFGASGVFSEIESAFGDIWGVPPAATSTAKTVLSLLKSKVFAFAVVLGASLLLLASLGVTATLGALREHIASREAFFVWRVADLVASVIVHGLAFATLYRLVPHAPVRWRDALRGGIVAALLTALLRAGYVLYLTKLGGYTAYGVVGAVLGLLAWIYLVALAFLFGAELAHLLGRKRAAS